MIGTEASSNCTVPWVDPTIVSSKMYNTKFIYIRLRNKLSWHTKSTSVSLRPILEAGSIVL